MKIKVRVNTIQIPHIKPQIKVWPKCDRKWNVKMRCKRKQGRSCQCHFRVTSVSLPFGERISCVNCGHTSPWCARANFFNTTYMYLQLHHTFNFIIWTLLNSFAFFFMDNELCLILSIQQNVLLTSATGIPANFVVLLVVWYFHVFKGYSLDSIKNFTMFHFLNMDINGNEAYSQYWTLSCLEYQLLSLSSRNFRIWSGNRESGYIHH